MQPLALQCASHAFMTHHHRVWPLASGSLPMSMLSSSGMSIAADPGREPAEGLPLLLKGLMRLSMVPPWAAEACFCAAMYASTCSQAI